MLVEVAGNHPPPCTYIYNVWKQNERKINILSYFLVLRYKPVTTSSESYQGSRIFMKDSRLHYVLQAKETFNKDKDDLGEFD